MNAVAEVHVVPVGPGAGAAVAAALGRGAGVVVVGSDPAAAGEILAAAGRDARRVTAWIAGTGAGSDAPPVSGSDGGSDGGSDDAAGLREMLAELFPGAAVVVIGGETLDDLLAPRRYRHEE